MSGLKYRKTGEFLLTSLWAQKISDNSCLRTQKSLRLFTDSSPKWWLQLTRTLWSSRTVLKEERLLSFRCLKKSRNARRLLMIIWSRKRKFSLGSISFPISPCWPFCLTVRILQKCVSLSVTVSTVSKLLNSSLLPRKVRSVELQTVCTLKTRKSFLSLEIL